MALATWWRGDSLPQVKLNSGFRAGASRNMGLISRVTELDMREVAARLDAGHRAYLAWLGDTPVGYGWVATQAASVDELDLAFKVPPEDRYLWDFKTLPPWRRRGIYPQLLQTIMTEEAANAWYLWIIHAPENTTSASGIQKAGFQSVAELSFLTLDRVAAVPYDRRAWPGASLLGVPLVNQDEASLAVSWDCVLTAREAHQPDAPCWPENQNLERVTNRAGM